MYHDTVLYCNYTAFRYSVSAVSHITNSYQQILAGMGQSYILQHFNVVTYYIRYQYTQFELKGVCEGSVPYNNTVQ